MANSENEIKIVVERAEEFAPDVAYHEKHAVVAFATASLNGVEAKYAVQHKPQTSGSAWSVTPENSNFALNSHESFEEAVEEAKKRAEMTLRREMEWRDEVDRYFANG